MSQTFTEVISKPFTVAWLSWIVMFLFIEGLAIFSKVEHATFSAHVRDFLTHQPWWVQGIMWVFLAWLAAHLLLGLRK